MANDNRKNYPQSEKIKLPPDVEIKLSKLIREGKKIEAMKEVLDLTGAGLRLAKDYVDELEQKTLLWSNKPNPKQ